MTRWGWVVTAALAACSGAPATLDGGRPDAPLACPRVCGDLELCCDVDGRAACVAAFFNDRNNCGGCGVRCADDEACGIDGRCYRMFTVCDPCADDEYCCDGYCISNNGGTTTTDPEFFACGGCGIGCNFHTANRCGVLDGVTQCMCGDGPACSGAETCQGDFGRSCAL